MARKPVKTAARKGRKPPPPNETRRDRFCRIGERRVNDVLGKIMLLGNLSSPNYECTAEDLHNMRQTLDDAIEIAFARFTPRKFASREHFSFKRGNAGDHTEH